MCSGIDVEDNRGFRVALGLSILFAIALTYLTLEISSQINFFLREIIPDYGIGDEAAIAQITETLRPIGYVALLLTVALIFIGFILRKQKAVLAGSIALYLPVFGHFAASMFFLSGIGAVRILWLPVFDVSPWLFDLGAIVYLPILLLFLAGGVIWMLMPLVFALPFIIQGLGFMVFLLGAMTWFQGRFKDVRLVDFWTYRYSRHPQYLGFIIWSYGLLVYTVVAPIPFGGLYFVPSLPWLLSIMLIVGVALYEENQMIQKNDEHYLEYRTKVPFLMPLPRRISNLLSAPVRIVLKKDWPENGREIVIIVILYSVILMLLSVPLALLVPF
ncbi:MAG: methyltransferase family protein [Candidatus Thorarchaeota archaeon]